MTDERADNARIPRLIPSRTGARRYSLDALAERCVQQFNSEHGGGSLALEQAETSGKRFRLILDSAEYVFAVESVAVSDDDRIAIVQRAYSELFGYGPLDPLLADPSITSIYLSGARKVAVRFGSGEPVQQPLLFDDLSHLERIVGRLLADAGASVSPELGLIETGLRIGGRPTAFVLATPPFVPEYNVSIRLHPADPPALDQLTVNGFITPEAADQIIAIVRSGYGIAIVGEPESGKTTLLNALLPLLCEGRRAVVVDRARELRPPANVDHLSPVWAAQEAEARSFGDQIAAAAELSPDVLVLDEVRADEPAAIEPLLSSNWRGRQIWSVRGAPDAKRLQSAMGMLARRAGLVMDEARVHAYYERLPFVLTVARISGRLQLFSIAEWQSRIDTDYPDYRMLYHYRDGAARPTGEAPARWLDPPPSDG